MASPFSGITFQIKEKQSNPIKLLDITIRVLIISFTTSLNLHADLLDLLDEDGCSYIGLKPLQSSKLVIPTKGIMIFVF